jgi:site-specific DNA recombinase
VPKFFAYIRVSTARQGEGVSLPQQRDSILRCAQKAGLTIDRWFEEKVTAAKRGRPLFTEMLKLLEKGQATGVIIHKIDRSARNLKDWADLGELIDRGIDVRFANESLDLQTRGGRLSADIQAVVAADYIRNLREETKKGIYGRFKQGLYPMPAPIGYIDRGAGKAKEPDPVKGPLIRAAFELYSTGQYSLSGLASVIARRGLTNRSGGTVSRNGWSRVLHNPFYIGLIKLETTKETFPGIHAPLVSAQLFRRVQRVLNGKVNGKVQVHDFQFRRLLKCGNCGYALVGERQKGHAYYRCHTHNCETKGIREEVIDKAILTQLNLLQFSRQERAYLSARLKALKLQWNDESNEKKESFDSRIRQITERLSRLTDAYIDGDLEKRLFEERKAMLLEERRNLEDILAGWDNKKRQTPDRLAKFLELAGNAYRGYEAADPAEKRELLQIVTSNRTLTGKSLDISLVPPFRQVAERFLSSNGEASRAQVRMNKLLAALSKLIDNDPGAEQILDFALQKNNKLDGSDKDMEVAA